MVRKLKGSSNNNGQSDIIRRAQELQGRMLAIQEELKDKFVKAEVAGGSVVVEANGQKDIVNITIAQELIDDASTDKDPKILSDLILSAIKDAMQKAEELAEKENNPNRKRELERILVGAHVGIRTQGYRSPSYYNKSLQRILC